MARRVPTLLIAAAGAALVMAAVPGRPGATAAAATTAPTFTAPARADDPAISAKNGQTYVSEPATIVGADGTRYVAYQGDSQLSSTKDGGKTWQYLGGADVLTKNQSGCAAASDVGDVDLGADSAGRVYFADLEVTAGGTLDNGIQPVVGISDDGFAKYSVTCSAHQTFMVDREWMATFTPPGQGSDNTRVYLTYHDFGPNTIWANVSKDGGKTWSTPVDIITDPASAVNSFCDTVPAGTAVDPRTGWVYAAWTAGSSAPSNIATGCNYTQGTVFNNFYVAVSKDEGATWTTTRMATGGGPTDPTPQDMSEIFGSIAVDRAGNVHVVYPQFSQRDGEFEIFAVSSPPADGSNVLHPSAATKVSDPGVHTAYFPRIVAGDDGRVDVIYLGTPVKNVIATPQNKLTFTGADATQPNCTPEVTSPGKGVRFPGKPCELPATAAWSLFMAQSIDANSATPTFANQKLRADSVHTGDICTLGIFCLPLDNRDLADVNDVKIDATGGAQVAYTFETADGSRTEIDFQCQTGGTGLLANVAVKSCLDVAPATAAAAPAATAPSRTRLPATGRRSPWIATAGIALVILALALRRSARSVRRR